MTTNALHEVQTKLEERGVLDVKFFFNGDMLARSNSDVKTDVAYLLESYERGDHTVMPRFGDSAGLITQ